MLHGFIRGSLWGTAVVLLAACAVMALLDATDP